MALDLGSLMGGGGGGGGGGSSGGPVSSSAQASNVFGSQTSQTGTGLNENTIALIAAALVVVFAMVLVLKK